AGVGGSPAALGRVASAEITRLLDRHFVGPAGGPDRDSRPGRPFDLGSLFRDEQRRVLKKVLRASLADTTAAYSRVYEQNLPLMRFLKHLGVPLPRPFQATADLLFNTDLRWAFADDDPDFGHIRTLLADASAWGGELDTRGLGYKFGKMLARAAERWREAPGDLALLSTLLEGVELAGTLPFEPDLWKPQNVYVELAEAHFLTEAEQAREV